MNHTLKSLLCGCWLTLAVTSALADDTAGARRFLPGFEPSKYFNEQVLTERFEDFCTFYINAPGDYDAAKPTRLVFYALPNGNTIAQTIGRQKAPDVDWHFYIQHIGAQTRYLRSLSDKENLVVAYLEADGRSWPHMRRSYEDSGDKIQRLIDHIRQWFKNSKTHVTLSSHSGGGAFVLEFIKHVEALPPWLDRIIFLDSNYSFRDELHGEKLVKWLKASKDTCLGVYSYNDRDVTFNGKPIVSKTGGTWRATLRMRDSLGKSLQFKESNTEQWQQDVALDHRVELIRLYNPENKILHTVLVERNGLIHGLTFKQGDATGAMAFYSDPCYEKWIQPD